MDKTLLTGLTGLVLTSCAANPSIQEARNLGFEPTFAYGKLYSACLVGENEHEESMYAMTVNPSNGDESIDFVGPLGEMRPGNHVRVDYLCERDQGCERNQVISFRNHNTGEEVYGDRLFVSVPQFNEYCKDRNVITLKANPRISFTYPNLDE